VHAQGLSNAPVFAKGKGGQSLFDGGGPDRGGRSVAGVRIPDKGWTIKAGEADSAYIFLQAHGDKADFRSIEIRRLTGQDADTLVRFAPPDSLAGQYGTFRSPLRFYNGKQVKTAADWKRRKKEIRERWHHLMGKWPPLLELQRLTVDSSQQKDGYIQHRVRFKWTPDEWTDGYLLIPNGEGKRAAVITVFYEPETAAGIGGKPHRDFARQLAKRGFIALSIGTREASRRQEFSLYYPTIEQAEVQPLSMLAYAAANAWHVLANVPEVDPARIGIIGHSFGGKWAMFASCLFDKFACAVWSDPGIVFEDDPSLINYWEPWYLGYHPKPWRKRGPITPDHPAFGLYPRLIREGYNLHELHALMAPRPFLVSGGAADPVTRWVPLNHTIAVNRLLGYESRVAMTNRAGHSPTPASNEQMIAFLERFLRAENE